MAQNLSALANGALVKDAGTTYNGVPLAFRVIDKNHSGYPANSVTLITDKIISIKGFDGKESGNADSNRASYGNNRYRTSNLRQWLNSGGAASSWWTAQNLTDGTTNTNNKDASPTTANMAGYNGYNTEKGFLAYFSAELLAQLMTTSLTVAKNTITDGGSSETVSDKIFLASNTEVGLANENSIAEGSAFAMFNSNAARKATPTAEAVSNSNYTNTSLNTGAAWYWWLRTPYASISYSARSVGASGALSDSNACNGHRGVRPLCNLPSGILVSDSPDSDGAYQIIWNQPPTDPSSITVPGTILAGQSFAVLWGASSDPESALSGYKLERQLNGSGTWTQIYSGSSLTFTTSVASGNTSVAYRVKAFDTAELESGYRTSETRTVTENNPPTISGSDSNLGTKTGAFNQTYTVTDSDVGATITVTEKIDGVQKRSYTATSGASQTFSVTADDFVKLANGSHTLTITAADQYGASATRTYTFSRNESQILVELATPLAADAMPERIILAIGRVIPAGATLTVEVCNNGNDASPAWENCTNNVQAGLLYNFTNSAKTAANWGVNIWVSVDRNGASGDCYISSIGGNFD
ncbi:MAG: DUF6273 domain-containing protein [Clostridium sp.]|jgi:hypothetical protein|nr:DUF6273 domain-containing protein [Clostridium sp.]